MVEPEARTAAEPSPRAVAVATLAVALALAGLWALGGWGLHVSVLTTFRELPPTEPLYAFWQPVLRPATVAFVAVALVVALLTPAFINPRRVRTPLFALVVFLVALFLPFALFLVRDTPGQLGRQFLIYQGEEYFEDAMRIRDLGGFVRDYAELTPKLSTHGRTHPPGNAVFLYLASRAFGRSPLAAGVAVLVCFALGAVVAWRALAAVFDECAARVGALLVLASPAVLDFACTSMDAVFFTAASLALWAGVLAFRNARRAPLHAAAAGAALLLAMFFSYSAFPVGLFLAVYGVAQMRAIGRAALLRLGIVLAAFLAAAVLLALVTGCALWLCFLVARGEHTTQMTHFIGRAPGTVYGYLVYGNATVFLIGAGLALAPLAALRLVRAVRARRLDSWTLATLVALAVMCAGGLYTLEAERIWLFAVPWLAGAAVADGALPAPRSLRFSLGAGWLQALAMEALLFTLW